MMTASMTPANNLTEIYEHNMKDSSKWRKNKDDKWTYLDLNKKQLCERAIQYDPELNPEELWKEHIYKTAKRLVREEKDLCEESDDEEKGNDEDLESEDEEEQVAWDTKVTAALKAFKEVAKNTDKKPTTKGSSTKKQKGDDGTPDMPGKKKKDPEYTIWAQFLLMNRIKTPAMSAANYTKYVENNVDLDGNPLKLKLPVKFHKGLSLEPHYMKIEIGETSKKASWAKVDDIVDGEEGVHYY